MSQLKRSILLILIPSLSCTACIHLGEELVQATVGQMAPSRSTHVLQRQYLGTYGPRNIIVEDQEGVQERITLELIEFPGFRKGVELGLSRGERQSLERECQETLRDFFGSSKSIKLIETKLASNTTSKSHYLDAELEDGGYSAIETLLDRGLGSVNRDLAKKAKMETLLRIEHDAREAKRGFWKYHKTANFKWP